MLILSRKKDQVICIGDEIKLTVVHIGHNAVRIGVDAPRDLPVHRQEVYNLIKGGANANAVQQ